MHATGLITRSRRLGLAPLSPLVGERWRGGDGAAVPVPTQFDHGRKP
jgi:hypothetical protein